MHLYRLRYFFSAGSNVCLWAGDEAARQKWDYPIDAQCLPLPENTWRLSLHLCAWYDTSIDWSYPPNPSPWDVRERTNFNLAAQRFLANLREQLGADFEIIDESETA